MLDWIDRKDLGDGIAYMKIADAMSDAIRSGRLPTGTRLPTQRELAAQLRLNVGTVSRAYNDIKEKGLIESRPRLGTYVRSVAQDGGEDGARAEGARELINLGTNTRIPAAFADAFGATLSELGQRPDSLRRIEGYKPVGGMAEHRAAAAQWLSDATGGFDPEQVLITDSATTAIMAVLLAACQGGDVVLTESLTFPGLKLAARVLGLRLEGVEHDGEGMVPEALDRACTAHGARVVVVTPTLQNPTCAIMGEARRRAIADVAARHGVLVVEDGVYRDMVPDGMRVPRIATFLPDLTIAVSSLSKTVAQVLRIGFIAAPRSFVPKLLGPLQAIAFTGPTLMAEVFSRWVGDGTLRRVIDVHRREIAEREAVARLLMDGHGFVSHPFSSHSWLELPDARPASDFFAGAMRAGVALRLADEFAVAPPAGGGKGVRITLGAARTLDELRAALGVLRGLLDEPEYGRNVLA